MFAALHYDAASMILDGMKKEGPTAEGIKKYLDNVKDFDGVTGKLSFNQTHDVSRAGTEGVTSCHALRAPGCGGAARTRARQLLGLRAASMAPVGDRRVGLGDHRGHFPGFVRAFSFQPISFGSDVGPRYNATLNAGDPVNGCRWMIW